MATEIEVKYLVKEMPVLDSSVKSEKIIQGYLHRSNGTSKATIRVRQLGDKGYLTIKGEKTGLSQPEFEYEIPLAEAQALFNLCEPGILEKTRYYIPHGEHTIELDVFGGKNTGLIVAEIELSSEEDNFEIPSWFDKDVSKDNNYSNAALSKP